MGTLSSELGPIVGRSASDPRVYADANVPMGLVAFMRQRLRWDVFCVMEHDSLRRARDLQHFRLAREMRRTLLTLDRDYIDDRRFPPAESAGVIVIWAPDATRLEEVLRRIDTRLLRPAEAAPSLDCPLAGRKVQAHSGWP